MKKTLILAIMTAGIFSLTTGVRADNALMSPKAQEMADSLRTVPSAPDEVNLALNRPVGNAKAWEIAQSLRQDPSTGPSVDLAHAPRPTLPAKDSNYDVAWRQNAMQQIQIAPLK
jgi:hypothetical protein